VSISGKPDSNFVLKYQIDAQTSKIHISSSVRLNLANLASMDS
jgi:hypothetical protein